MRKRKINYPAARAARKPAPTAGAGPEPTYVRPTVVTIDLTATTGRGNFAVGDRVRIVGTGLYAGEAAVVESAPNGIIPAALVRTEAGRTRRVRTIDLELLAREG